MFWREWHSQPDGDHIIGDCRAKPPQLFMVRGAEIDRDKFITKWPSVWSEHFCGRFEPEPINPVPQFERLKKEAPQYKAMNQLVEGIRKIQSP